MEFLYQEHKIHWNACTAVTADKPEGEEQQQDGGEELKLDPETDLIREPTREGTFPEASHPAFPYCSHKKFCFIPTPEVTDAKMGRIFNSYYMSNSVSYAFS